MKKKKKINYQGLQIQCLQYVVPADGGRKAGSQAGGAPDLVQVSVAMQGECHV